MAIPFKPKFDQSSGKESESASIRIRQLAKYACAPELSLVIFGVLSWAASYLPQMHFLAAGFNLPDFYGENIGFRFFWSMRWVDGAPDDFIHPGQGVLFPYIQAGYYSLTKILEQDLFERTVLFGDLTLIGAAVSMLGLTLVIARDRRVPWQVRFLFLTAPLVMALSHKHMFAYHLYPDYNSYEKIVLLGSVYFFVREFFYGVPSISSFILMGVLAGLSMSIKINMGVFLIGLLFVSSGRQSYPITVKNIVVTLIVTVAIFLSLILAYYKLNISSVVFYFLGLASFSAGHWEFPWGDLAPWKSWSEHTMSNLTWLCILLLAVAIVQIDWVRGQAIGAAAAVCLLAAVAVAMAVWRGGGTSYFDAVVVLTLLVGVLSSLPSSRRTLFLPTAVAVFFIGWSAIWTATHWTNYITNDGLLSAPIASSWQSEVYEWNRRQGLPVYAIFPSNPFVVGSVEDMMMRGFSNFATPWYSANENPSLRKLFPDFRFGSYDIAIPEDAVVLEWVTASRPFRLVDEAALAENNASIATIVANRKLGPCISRGPNMPDGPIVRSCVMR